jgi:hypothetical protein
LCAPNKYKSKLIKKGNNLKIEFKIESLELYNQRLYPNEHGHCHAARAFHQLKPAQVQVNSNPALIFHPRTQKSFALSTSHLTFRPNPNLTTNEHVPMSFNKSTKMQSGIRMKKFNSKRS